MGVLPARNFRYTVRGHGDARGCHTVSQGLEYFFVVFADRTWKAFLWKVSIVKSGC